MKPTIHFAASTAISFSLYFITDSPAIAVTSFISGFLIDSDHLFDYFREYGLKPDIREFLQVFHETRFRRLMLIFHAWEWVILFGILAILYNSPPPVVGLLIGISHHLLLDQFGNGPTNWGYFFTYRAAKRFSTMEVIRETVINEKRRQMQGE